MVGIENLFCCPRSTADYTKFLRPLFQLIKLALYQKGREGGHQSEKDWPIIVCILKNLMSDI